MKNEKKESKNKRSLSFTIRGLFIVQTLISVFLLAGLFLISVTVKRQKNDLIVIQNQKEQLQLLADEIWQTSIDLTRLCRVFAVTGKEEFFTEYFNIIKWRSGEIPRPDSVHAKLYRGRTISQTDLLKELGCTETELSLLNKASALSNELTAIENQAMESIRKNAFIAGPRQLVSGEDVHDFAIRILHDDVYRENTDKIMAPIETFYETVEQRTDTAVERESRKLDIYQTTALIFIIALIVSLGFFVIFLNKSVINPIIFTASCLENIAEGDGDLTVSLPVKGNNEIARLSAAFNKTIKKSLQQYSRYTLPQAT